MSDWRKHGTFDTSNSDAASKESAMLRRLDKLLMLVDAFKKH
jgi:hypothetical protein